MLMFEVTSTQLTERMRKLSRLAVAIGGFLIMMGMILIGAIALTLLNIIDPSAFMNDTYLLLFMVALLSVGVLDIIAGIILSRG
jgi:hypothetical protein